MINRNWDPIHYSELLKKDELTEQEIITLKRYRLSIYKQLCWNDKKPFVSCVSKYLHEKMDPEHFRLEFIQLSSDLFDLVGYIEQDPSQLSNLIIEKHNLELPFFKLKQTIFENSMAMLKNPDVMSESDFQTLVGRFYYDHLISEDV